MYSQPPSVAFVSYESPSGASVAQEAPVEQHVVAFRSRPASEPLGEVPHVRISQLQDDISDVIRRRLPEHEEACAEDSPHLYRALVIARVEGLA